MAGLTVAAGLVRGLVDVAVSRGAKAADLFARSGINPAALEDQDNRVPFENYVSLMRTAKAACNDPALGLHFGELNDLTQVSVVGLIAEASETVFEAMQQMNRYGRLVVEIDGGPQRFKTVHQDGGLWIVDARENPNDFHELTESTFARALVAARRIGKPLVKRIHVTHPDPGYGDEYQRIFEAPVTFGARWNAMEIDERVLATPFRRQPGYVFGILSKHADALLAELEQEKVRSMRGRVESVLLVMLHKGDPSVDAAADKLGMSRQTLYRKLKAEGTTFERLLDQLRHRLALGYLSGRKASVNEIAYLVGFSEPAAFSRAFRRWTGQSPRDFRASASEADGQS
jgi:AraC-like DNA-binding protein